MQTIQLQIQDELYETISSKGININSTVQEFLYNLVDDGFPAISTDEAKQKVVKTQIPINIPTEKQSIKKDDGVIVKRESFDDF